MADTPTPTNDEQAPEGYAEISQAEQQRAEKLVASAAKVAGMGNWDYAIELYMGALAVDPENLDIHKALRSVSMQRKAKGGKPMGMFEKGKYKGGKTDKDKLLNAERLLAFDPGNTDYMATMLKAAADGGYYGTALWIGPILLRANIDGKQDFSKFILLKDVFSKIGNYKLALDALSYARHLKPESGDLSHEEKDLAARMTMQAGKYESAESFVDSIRNRDAQQEHLERDKDIRTEEGMAGEMAKAKAALEADPKAEGKIMAYAEVLAKTDDSKFENEALELLESAHKDSGNFRFKQRANQIKIRQAERMEHTMRKMLEDNPDDEDLKQDYADFKADRDKLELEHYRDMAKAYPQDLGLKYHVGRKLFDTGEAMDAIPMFQQSQTDAKVRKDSRLMLGKSFLEAGFVEEAVDTLGKLLEETDSKTDARGLDLQYWYGRSLEENGDFEPAAKAYSSVAQTDFNYRDVRQRLADVRAKGK
ncbi:MAG: hypothetical protein AAGD32_05910 [Planctomycetota bacterium]